MKLLGVVAGLIFASAVAAQEPTTNFAGTYYCKINAMGGLSRIPGTDNWKATPFNTEDLAYKVTVTDTGELFDTELFGNYRVYKIKANYFGEPPNKFGCRAHTQIDPADGEKIAIPDGGTAQCFFFKTNFLFDFKENLIQVLFSGGYMDPAKKDTDTPFVAVGKCDKIG